MGEFQNHISFFFQFYALLFSTVSYYSKTNLSVGVLMMWNHWIFPCGNEFFPTVTLLFLIPFTTINICWCLSMGH